MPSDLRVYLHNSLLLILLFPYDQVLSSQLDQRTYSAVGSIADRTFSGCGCPGNHCLEKCSGLGMTVVYRALKRLVDTVAAGAGIVVGIVGSVGAKGTVYSDAGLRIESRSAVGRWVIQQDFQGAAGHRLVCPSLFVGRRLVLDVEGMTIVVVAVVVLVLVLDRPGTCANRRVPPLSY